MSDGGGSETVIIKTALWRRLGLLIGGAVWLSIAACLFGVSLYLSGDASELVTVSSVTGSIELLVFVAIALAGFVYGLRNMWRGDYIRLEPEGFYYKVQGQKGHVPWQALKGFRTEAPMSGMAEVVGWDYHEGEGADPLTWRRLRTTGRYPTSLHGDLGHRWQGGSRVVCEALESWRARYACMTPRNTVARQAALADGDAVLIVHAAAWKTLLSLVVLGAVIVLTLGLSAWAAGISRPVDASDWLTVLAPCLGLVVVGPLFWVCLRRLIARSRLTLTSAGFEVADEAGRLFTAWHEVEVFGLIHHAQSHHTTVGWRFKNKPDADLYSAEMHQAVGGEFQVSPYALRDTLDDWRIRYSQGH